MTGFPPPGGDEPSNLPPPPPPSAPGWGAPAPPPPAGPGWGAPAPPPPAGPGWGAPPPSGYPPPPPGYPAPPGYPQPGFGYGPPPGGFERLGGLNTALTILLIVTALVALIGLGAMLNRVAVGDDILSRRATPADVEEADNGVRAARGLFGAAVVASGVLWIIWQYRVVTNAQRLGTRMALGPGWAIASWFVPIGNLVLGAVQLKSAAASGPDRRAPAVLYAWALAFPAAFVLFWVGIGSQPDEDGSGIVSAAQLDQYFKDFQAADRLGATAFGLYLIAAILALALVRSITQQQRTATGQQNL